MIMDSNQTAWQFNTAYAIKPEPMEAEDRNDSGINSGSSDFHSSSPGSDNSQDLHNPYCSPQTELRYNSTPIIPRLTTQNATTLNYTFTNQNPFAHNPLTPPNSEPLASPKSENEQVEKTEAEASATTPPTGGGDHLRQLEMSLERSGIFPAACSSKSSEPSIDGDSKSELDDDEECNISVPRVNSHGKLKKFKCKQCSFVAITKIEFWVHSKTHIKVDKRLYCKKCPFVTEYKHHLEYHLLNHAGSKPFKCNMCSYSCVNKSMLNSHLKSHSNVYQYRCADCTYATKYCHSLKLHLRKYAHNPAMVLNIDGTPNPAPIIDVYGSRRGPKQKQSSLVVPGANNNEDRSMQMPFSLTQLMAQQQLQIPLQYQLMNNLTGQMPNPQVMQTFQKLMMDHRQAAVATSIASEASETLKAETQVLDLSKPGTSGVQSRNRRKGRAFKLQNTQVDSSDDEDKDNETSMDGTTMMFSNVEVVEEKGEDVAPKTDESINENNNSRLCEDDRLKVPKEQFYDFCKYCNIGFGDPALYAIHAGQHGYDNPFTCNLCGTVCTDKISFFVHISRHPH